MCEEGVDLDADLDGHRRIREAIERLVDEGHGFVDIQTVPVDPAPYDWCAKKLRFRIVDRPNRIRARDGFVEVTGAVEDLKVFHTFFEVGISESPSHSHYDYYDGNEWVHPMSVSLVINYPPRSG